MISGVVITYNEEKHIERCLRSMQGVVDEIVVLDSFSTDKTPDICKSLGVRFFQQKFIGFGPQKRDAVALAHYDFILSLDADEMLTDELRNEIVAIKKSDMADAYSINRRNHYNGIFIRHCGWYPDYMLRLFNRTKVNWNDNLVHETVAVPTGVNVVNLKSDMLHFTYDGYEQHLANAMKYAALSAKQRQEKGKKPNVLLASVKACFRFFKTYILRLGILDGYYGFLISKVSAKYAYHKYCW